MIDYASLILEESLDHTEANALQTLSAGKDLLRPLRKLRTAAETGDLAEMDRSVAAAQTALAMLQRRLKETKKSWVFDVHGYLAKAGYAQEVLAMARRAGVNMSKREDRLFCHQALIRIAPGEKAVHINRKRERHTRPSVFVNLLKAQQDRPCPIYLSLSGCSSPGLGPE